MHFTSGTKQDSEHMQSLSKPPNVALRGSQILGERMYSGLDWNWTQFLSAPPQFPFLEVTAMENILYRVSYKRLVRVVPLT